MGKSILILMLLGLTGCGSDIGEGIFSFQCTAGGEVVLEGQGVGQVVKFESSYLIHPIGSEEYVSLDTDCSLVFGASADAPPTSPLVGLPQASSSPPPPEEETGGYDLNRELPK